MVKYISFDDVVSMNPGERLWTVQKEEGSYYIVADIEENMNLFDEDFEAFSDKDLSYRVENYYSGNWVLDPQILFDPNESAVGERRGEVPGGIEFYFEDADDWSFYSNVYECYFEVAGAGGWIIEIDELEDLKKLPDGIYNVIMPEGVSP